MLIVLMFMQQCDSVLKTNDNHIAGNIWFRTSGIFSRCFAVCSCWPRVSQLWTSSAAFTASGTLCFCVSSFLQCSWILSILSMITCNSTFYLQKAWNFVYSMLNTEQIILCLSATKMTCILQLCSLVFFFNLWMWLLMCLVTTVCVRVSVSFLFSMLIFARLDLETPF